MSLRAIKKRENQYIGNAAGGARQSLFKKSTTSPQQRKVLVENSNSSNSSNNNNNLPSETLTTATLSSLHSLRQQHTLLGRSIHSSPELRHPSDTLELLAAAHAHLVRTKSADDISTLLSSCTRDAAEESGDRNGLIGAKSEVCLQTISSHSYQLSERNTTKNSPLHRTENNDRMLSGGRLSCDLSRSAYSPSPRNDRTASIGSRRMSESSLASSAPGYTHRSSSAMSSSALTLSSSTINPEGNAVARVPIIGYEVMEERARFTVYKLRVENPQTNDCWLVLRRYTDFVRLNSKLKQAFPLTNLTLPRKKIFGDNFNSVFLDNRVQGLQIFVNSVMAKEELRKSKIVREFFCLDEPPTYSESMEECRAIFEAQEETIAHLKLQINNKNDLILSLQQKLRQELMEKDHLKEVLKVMAENCPRCGSYASGNAI